MAPAVASSGVAVGLNKGHTVTKSEVAKRSSSTEGSITQDSPDPQEARVRQGRREYEQGNFEAAVRTFGRIDLRPNLSRLQDLATNKARHRRRSRAEAAEALSSSLRKADVLIEAIYLKAKCLQALGNRSEAVKECEGVMDLIESTFPQGLPDAWTSDSRLSVTIGRCVELLPKLFVEDGRWKESVAAFRRALIGRFGIDAECAARIRKEFAVLLLYGGEEASNPKLCFQSEGAFIPKSNMEESILLLLLVLRQASLKKVPYDPTVIEHLSFALSVCGQPEFLAQQYEMILPGIQSRSERWYNLALCYNGTSKDDISLNLLKRTLNHVESPNDVCSLLLAAKLCAKQAELAKEGVGYAERAVEHAKGNSEHLKGTALHFLGVLLGCAARSSLSDAERTRLHGESLSVLQEAASLEKADSKVIFDLGLEYAKQRNLGLALDCAKKFIDLSNGASVQGWKLLALVLSAQQRLSDAEEALDAALDETGKWEQGELLKMKAKVQIAQGQAMRAVDTYRLLLALVQAQRKSFEAGDLRNKGPHGVEEVEVWQSLAAVYTSLKQWSDAEICLEKAQALKAYSAETWHAAGVLHEAQDNIQDALAAYNNALAVDPDHVPSKVSTGALLRRRGGTSLPAARSFLTDALRSEPTNHHVWYNLGMLHNVEGRAREAADCFQASFLLDQSAPVENFNLIPQALFW